MIIRLTKDRLILFPFAISTIAVLIAIFIGFTKFVDVSGKLIINHNIWGLPVLGGLDEITAVILVSIAILLINLYLIYSIYNRERFFSYILSFSNVGISVLILVAILRVSSFN